MALTTFMCLDCTADFGSNERDAQLHEAARSHRVWPAPPPLPDTDRAIASALARMVLRRDLPPERHGAVHVRDQKQPHRRRRGGVAQSQQERFNNAIVMRAVNDELAAAGIGRSGMRVSPVGRYWH